MELRNYKLLCKETFLYSFPSYELAEVILANLLAFVQHLMLHESLQYLL